MSCLVKSVSEVALWVEDVDRATRFYVDHLGFEPVDSSPGQYTFLQGGNFLLVLFNPNNPGTKLANEYLARTGGPRGGVYHLAFDVGPERLDEIATQISTRGISIKGPIEFDNGRRSYFFEDPDQHYIELTDR